MNHLLLIQAYFNADTGSFLFSVIIGILFYMNYRHLETEARHEEMLENFLK